MPFDRAPKARAGQKAISRSSADLSRGVFLLEPLFVLIFLKASSSSQLLQTHCHSIRARLEDVLLRKGPPSGFSSRDLGKINGWSKSGQKLV